jgi:hypothetical protein
MRCAVAILVALALSGCYCSHERPGLAHADGGRDAAIATDAADGGDSGRSPPDCPDGAVVGYRCGAPELFRSLAIGYTDRPERFEVLAITRTAVGFGVLVGTKIASRWPRFILVEVDFAAGTARKFAPWDGYDGDDEAVTLSGGVLAQRDGGWDATVLGAHLREDHRVDRVVPIRIRWEDVTTDPTWEEGAPFAMDLAPGPGGGTVLATSDDSDER